MRRGQAVGFIEAIGLPAAIAAADAAVKSANVELVGRELSKGGGYVTVKIQGDVGAVKAALAAARTVSDKVHGTQAVLVIPRPARGVVDAMVKNVNAETMGVEPDEPEPTPPSPSRTPEPEDVGEISLEMVGPERTEGMSANMVNEVSVESVEQITDVPQAVESESEPKGELEAVPETPETVTAPIESEDEIGVEVPETAESESEDMTEDAGIDEKSESGSGQDDAKPKRRRRKRKQSGE